MIQTAAVNVGTNPTLLNVVPDKDNASGQTVIVQPATDIYIGGPDVTVNNGLLAPSGYGFSVDLRTNSDKFYGVAASGSVSTRVMQVGV